MYIFPDFLCLVLGLGSGVEWVGGGVGLEMWGKLFKKILKNLLTFRKKRVKLHISTQKLRVLTLKEDEC